MPGTTRLSSRLRLSFGADISTLFLLKPQSFLIGSFPRNGLLASFILASLFQV
jgi:hypothetical protein